MALEQRVDYIVRGNDPVTVGELLGILANCPPDAHVRVRIGGNTERLAGIKSNDHPLVGEEAIILWGHDTNGYPPGR